MQDEILDYIPVRKKNQLIIPYDFQQQKYGFMDSDVKYLLKIIQDKELLYKIIHTLESSKSLNPYRSSWRKITLKIFLYFVFGILFLMFSYLWIGIFIFFLADPVICFLYGYSIMYQLWWRGGRVGMEMIVEFRKSRPLEKYIKKLNQQVFGPKRLQFSVGGGGKWIQIDNLKRM